MIYQIRAIKIEKNAGPESFFAGSKKEAGAIRRGLRKDGYEILRTVAHQTPETKGKMIALLDSVANS